MGTLVGGTRIGAYDVLAMIGAGGMGEVYRARDTKLKREVALKVLPEALSQDSDRLARFQREAELLATLNHTNIAAVYGLEQADGVTAIVLELVEGETLADMIGRGPLATSDALQIARQITLALEAAHEKGIVHRDLKPANMKITPQGVVKVLDFGLAKIAAVSSAHDLSQSPTAAGATREGIVLGTVAYMSPEQARGKSVDKRTDIWAFGCVLYEMLTGRAAFAGDTASDLIAAILEREPKWDALVVTTPRTIGSLVKRCLEKDPQRRLRDIGDARIELDDALSGPIQVEIARQEPSGITRRTAITALAGAAAGAAATGMFAVSRYRGDGTPRSLTRFAIAFGEGAAITASFNKRVAISPEGMYLACSPARQGVERLLTRSLPELDLKPVAENARGAPFFSPDGRWLGYFASDAPYRLRKVALSGGAPVTICTVESFGGGTWAADDRLYFVATLPGGLVAVPAAGGEPIEVLKIDFDKGERLHKYPHALPGGADLLFTIATVETESFDDASIAVFSSKTRQRKVLIEGGTHPRYSPSGHLVYARNGNLLAVRFDPSRLEVTGQPSTVLEGVLMSRNTGAANFDISTSGDLVYVPGKADGGARTLAWVDRSGKAEKLSLPPRSYLHPRISPDGRKLAIEIEGSSHDVFIYDFANGVLSNITTDGVSHWPVWSPDGAKIGYRSGPMGRFQLWQVPADRSRPAEQVPATGASQSAESYSPDGRAMAYTAADAGAPPRIVIAALDGDRTPQPLEPTKYAQGSPKFSPDGRWLAYCSNESGRPEVYAQAFPGPGAKTQVSNDGGTDPVWRRDGRELFYRSGDRMMAVEVATASSFTTGRPQELWTGHYSHGMSSSCGGPGLTSSNYDVMPDGQRFLMIEDADRDTASSGQMIMVQGWADALMRLSSRS